MEPGSAVCAGAVVYAGARIGHDAVVGDQAQVRERSLVGAESVIGRGTGVESDVAHRRRACGSSPTASSRPAR